MSGTVTDMSSRLSYVMSDFGGKNPCGGVWGSGHKLRGVRVGLTHS